VHSPGRPVLQERGCAVWRDAVRMRGSTAAVEQQQLCDIKAKFIMFLPGPESMNG